MMPNSIAILLLGLNCGGFEEKATKTTICLRASLGGTTYCPAMRYIKHDRGVHKTNCCFLLSSLGSHLVQQMSELVAFGLQVAAVVFPRGHLNFHPLDDLHAIAVQADDFLRVVGEQADL